MRNSTPPLSVATAAEQKGISPRTLRYAILRGELKADKLEGATGAYVIRQRDLDRWMAKRAEKASA
jgi:excisionase family DNA binding protein